MWGSVLGLAVLAALNPMRLGLALLMISRPRPGQNLLAYWAGGLTVCLPELLIPLMLVNFTPMFRSFSGGSATQGTSSTLGHIQVGLGVLGLTAAALITLRLSVRQRAHSSASGDAAPRSGAGSDTAIAVPTLLSRAQDVSGDDRSAIRRLLGHIRDAWENGALWVAWVIGLASVPVDGVLFIVAIIVASRTTIATQVSASIAFVVVMYAVVEVILVGYVAKPARTQALLRVLHDWVRTYRWQILVAMLAVVGLSQLAQGIG